MGTSARPPGVSHSPICRWLWLEVYDSRYSDFSYFSYIIFDDESVRSMSPRMPRSHKPPAVLVHVLQGRNFANTVGSIKSAVDFPILKEKVRRMKKTRDGHALVKFTRKPGAYTAATYLGEAIRSRPEWGVGRVVELGLRGRIKIYRPDRVERGGPGSLEGYI